MGEYTFSEFVKGHRCKRGLTQHQLAALLRVSRTTITMWESGERKPTTEHLHRLFSALALADAACVEGVLLHAGRAAAAA